MPDISDPLTPGEMTAHLCARFHVNHPVLNEAEARQLGRIETWAYDQKGGNMVQLMDLCSALAFRLFHGLPANSWVEVSFDQIARLTLAPTITRIALLRLGIYSQLDTDSGKLVYSSAPRGISSHRVHRPDLSGLVWNGRDIVEAHGNAA
jgi:hypothetical protein